MQYCERALEQSLLQLTNSVIYSISHSIHLALGNLLYVNQCTNDDVKQQFQCLDLKFRLKCLDEFLLKRVSSPSSSSLPLGLPLVLDENSNNNDKAVSVASDPFPLCTNNNILLRDKAATTTNLFFPSSSSSSWQDIEQTIQEIEALLSTVCREIECHSQKWLKTWRSLRIQKEVEQLMVRYNLLRDRLQWLALTLDVAQKSLSKKQ
jgi:hypothetical protein